LAVLLAERSLKMSDIINDTTLSKTAIRGLYYNTSRGIQFDTLEAICDYLNVQPADVIKKIDFRYEIIDRQIDNTSGIIEYNIAFSYDDRKHRGNVILSLFGPDFKVLFDNDYSCIEMAFEISYDTELKQSIFAQITESEYENFQNYIVNDLVKIFHLEQHKVKHIFTKNIINDHIQKRVLDIAKYIIKAHPTIPQAAMVFKVSENTVLKDMFERLPTLDKKMAQEVKKILENDKSNREAMEGFEIRETP